MAAPTQLIVYAFGPDARYEGQLAGALERLESGGAPRGVEGLFLGRGADSGGPVALPHPGGGALRVVEVLFVGRDADSGELIAFEHRGDGAGGFTEPLLRFRLDAGTRVRTTERALDSAAGKALLETAESLEPGGAIAAVFI